MKSDYPWDREPIWGCCEVVDSPQSAHFSEANLAQKIKKQKNRFGGQNSCQEFTSTVELLQLEDLWLELVTE